MKSVLLTGRGRTDVPLVPVQRISLKTRGFVVRRTSLGVLMLALAVVHAAGPTPKQTTAPVTVGLDRVEAPPTLTLPHKEGGTPSHSPLPPATDKEVKSSVAVPQIHEAPVPTSGYALIDFQADYLMWWVRRPSLPIPLVTTAGNPFQDRPGVIGNADTRLLYGDQTVPLGMQNGIRGDLTIRYASDLPLSLHFGGFILTRQSKGFSAGSNDSGLPVLGQAIFNPLPNPPLTNVPGPGIFPVSLPPFNDRLLQVGSINIDQTINVYGYEANLAYDFVPAESCWTVRGLLGFRSVGLQETYSERAVSSSPEANFNVGPAPITGPPFSSIVIHDQIRTQSDFYGPQVGAYISRRLGLFQIDVTGKIAMGMTQNRVQLSGSSTGDGILTVPGGVRVTSSNAGGHSSDNFAVVPEARVDLGLALTRHLTAKFGYTFLYVSKVIRPGDQLDGVVNPALVPTSGLFNPFNPPPPDRPLAPNKLTDFWAQGISFALEMTY
jgi:hypothetical protein